ncbi:hypothetical protein BJV82DRAFT_675988 [Fennellomyces sp. T-0311]|nr:hypothetical protein BJV82DRAFT_675988 [Fennellomyces sp. T-0311]
MQGVVSDHIPKHDITASAATSSSDISDQYVWSLNVKSGNKPERVAKFVDTLKNMKTIIYQAAKNNRLGKSMGYKLRDMMLANPEVLPGYKLRSEVPSNDLSLEQKSFLAEYVSTSGPRIVLKYAAYALSEAYPEQKTINKVIKSYLQANLTFNLVFVHRPLVMESEEATVNQNRKQYAHFLFENRVDYGTKCVFIDRCKLARADIKFVAQKPKKTDIPIELGGYVCLNGDGIFAYSHEAHRSAKIKKLPIFEIQGAAKGTRLDHFQQFVESVIQILKEREQPNMYFVLEDLPYRDNRKVIEAIKKAHHGVILVPAKSSSFVPSYHLRNKLTKEIRRTPLNPNDNLASKVSICY